MKTTCALSVLGGLVRLSAAQWWFDGDRLDCAESCYSSFRDDDRSDRAWCTASSAASCISSACASASPSEFSEYSSATAQACSVYDSCSDGATQTITATRGDRSATATVTGCPDDNDNGWGWGGDWAGDWWDNDGDNDDGDDDQDGNGDGDHDSDRDGWDWWCDDREDRDGWACRTNRATATVTITSGTAAQTTVETQTVLQAVSGSVTQGTTIVAAAAAAPTDGDDEGSASVARMRARGLAMAAFVAGVVVL